MQVPFDLPASRETQLNRWMYLWEFVHIQWRQLPGPWHFHKNCSHSLDKSDFTFASGECATPLPSASSSTNWHQWTYARSPFSCKMGSKWLLKTLLRSLTKSSLICLVIPKQTKNPALYLTQKWYMSVRKRCKNLQGKLSRYYNSSWKTCY